MHSLIKNVICLLQHQEASERDSASGFSVKIAYLLVVTFPNPETFLKIIRDIRLGSRNSKGEMKSVSRSIGLIDLYILHYRPGLD